MSLVNFGQEKNSLNNKYINLLKNKPEKIRISVSFFLLKWPQLFSEYDQKMSLLLCLKNYFLSLFCQEAGIISLFCSETVWQRC